MSEKAHFEWCKTLGMEETRFTQAIKTYRESWSFQQTTVISVETTHHVRGDDHNRSNQRQKDVCVNGLNPSKKCPNPMENTQQKKKMCHFYQKGKCKYGSKCRNVHDSIGLEAKTTKHPPPARSIQHRADKPSTTEIKKPVKKAIKTNSLSKPNSSFACHSTNEKAAVSICDTGFGSERRSDQVYDFGKNFGWTAPFRWFWKDDNKNYQKYGDKDNSKIEKAYECWRCGEGEHIIRLESLIHFHDGRSQEYIIDLGELTQKDSPTSHPRQITREKITLSSGSVEWSYVGDYGGWIRYDRREEEIIEQRFQRYCNGTGRHVFQNDFVGGTRVYSYDFVDGIQTNLSTGTIRPMKRIVKA